MMSDEKEARRSVLLAEAKALKELLEKIIFRLESGETVDALRSEIEEMKTKIVELLQKIDSAQLDEFINQIKQYAAEASKRTREIFSDLLGPTVSTFEDLRRKGEEALRKFASGESDTIGREELKKKVLTPEFTTRFYDELRKRNWDDKGIQEALEVVCKIITSD
jgi:hypothetical protein